MSYPKNNLLMLYNTVKSQLDETQVLYHMIRP